MGQGCMHGTSIAFQYDRIAIVSELKTQELKFSEILTVCQQPVLTAVRYFNLSESTNGQK